MNAPSRHAVVTGCSSGIGAAICQALLADGWSVTGLSRTAPNEEAENFQHISVDLTESRSLRSACKRIGKVDAIIHAAGLLRTGTLSELDPNDGAIMWRLHVDAAVHLVQALEPGLADGGRIVFIGSRVAGGAPGKAQYAASKSALTGLARSFAAELISRRITVNIVAPAATDTPMLHDPARAGTAPKLPPLGRYVQPAEVASMAVYLLSDAAAAITGQTINICGGSSL